MLEVTRAQVFDALTRIGIQSGDGLLIHSAIQFLGKPADGVGMYWQVISDVLGPDGTVVVPAFNFDFARGVPFDPQNTPSKGMGVFPEYVRKLPQAARTLHPLQSVAAVGHYRDDLTGRDTPSAFDPNSAFDRMLQLDFRLLLLGADIQAASMVHYSEQRAEVPYRYWKKFTGEVKIGDTWVQRSYRMFVRDLEIGPELDLHPIQHLLTERGQWHSEKLNYGWLSSCRLKDFVQAADDLLAEHPWSLVGNAPEAIERYQSTKRY